MTKVLLITPPFTQLNTPYPATAYLKGFLNTINISSKQADLGIEVILKIFSGSGLSDIFKEAGNFSKPLSENAERIVALKDHYINTVDAVISFLQGKNPTLSHLICMEDFLPEASRFKQVEELDWAFGTMGTQDKAKHLATLYLEDISDLIVECVDSNFGFSRYAERLGRSAASFDELYESLQLANTYTDNLLLDILKEKIVEIIESIKNSEIVKLRGVGNAIIKTVSGVMYKSFSPYEKDKNFWTDDKCNGCSICREVCPANNIKIHEGKPQWQNKCEQCVACLQWCPQKSIQYKKVTINRGRYQHPEIKVKELFHK